MEFHKNAATLAVLVSACFVVCWGSALKYEDEDLPEINLPGLVLPNIDSLLDADADPKPCCLPKQWQGSVTSQSGWRAWKRRRGDVEDVDRRGRQGRSGFRQKTVNVYVDENSKKVAGRARCLNDTCGFVVVFGANTTADIYFFRMGARKCLHQKFNKAVFHKQCLPDNSTFEGSVKIGPSASGLGVQVWRYQGKPNHRGSLHPQVYVSGRAVVTSACIPVVFQDHGCFSLRRGGSDISQAEMEQAVSEEDLYDDQDDSNPHPRPGRIGGVFMGSSYFTNVEPAVKDPSVFTPPSYCKAAPGGDLELDVDMEYPDIIDRFVVLE